MKIRKATLEDMVKVNEAHKRSIREVCKADYSPEQVAKWSDVTYKIENWTKTVESDCCYLIVDGDEVYGFSHATIHKDGRGEILGLYLTPEVIGKGLGRNVFNKCMDYLKENNVKSLFLNGTKTAKAFYENAGFVSKELKTYNIRGVDVQVHYMEMILT